MSTPGSLPLADTSDMAGLHRVFRQALDNAPRFVGAVGDGEAERAELVGSYYDNVMRLLHGHHEGEDELLTPRLLERCPTDAALITRIARQHDDVLTSIGTAESQVAAWRADPTAANRDSTTQSLAQLNRVLTPHLDEEELEIVPLASTCINVAEWGEMPEHGMRTFTGDKAWLIMGLVQEQMRPEQIERMQANMPPPVLDFWTAQGQALFNNYVGELRR